MKKRESYGTIMIDINTHNILDMIDSREYDKVKQWLQTYENLKIVSRDGSITYRNAIEGSHPTAMQVCDRFHLLKNLTTYASNYLKKEMKQRVPITVKKCTNDVEGCNKAESIRKAEANRKLTLKEKYNLIQKFLSQDRKKTWICKELNMDVRSYDKIINMSPQERESVLNTKMMLQHEETVSRKMRLVIEVRNLKKDGLSNRGISRKTGLSTITVRKYLDKNFTPVHASYGKKKNGKLIPYIKEIEAFLEKGIMGSAIEKEIRKKGYDGSSSNLRHYITDWKRRRKQNCDKSSDPGKEIEFVERKDILKLLYHTADKIKGISHNQFERLCEEYPYFQKIHNIVWNFKGILKIKDVEELECWMHKARNMKICEIESFVNGLERDIDAVKNAIKYEYNNGLAEGSINKLKVIKRIMYGRCGFDTLRIKTLRLEKMRKIN